MLVKEIELMDMKNDSMFELMNRLSVSKKHPKGRKNFN